MHAKHTLSVLLAVLASTAAGAAAPAPRHSAHVVETTSQGYTLTVSVGASGKTGTLALSCPSGQRLGTSARFEIHHAQFTAIRTLARKRVFRFTGYFDQREHVRGHGSVRAGACGGGITSSFSEDAVGTARMLSCPASSPDAPLTAGAAYPFAGIVPNAALGTRLRLEYTDPNSPTGQPAVVHLRTDSSGRFSDIHAFPASGGEVYGASATPRHPDDPLAPGIPCGMQVQG
jgi:hypothetical protein